jgi:integrase
VAGRAGVTPHDLRRCAARNLSRAEVAEQIAMRITGHKTASMYPRYRIVNERDLREATQSLNGYLRDAAYDHRRRSDQESGWRVT